MGAEEVRELLPLYALGALGEEERQAVEAGLEAFPELREELRALQAATDQLALSLPPEPLPPGLEERILARVRPRRPWLAWLGSLAAAAVVLAAGWVGLQVWDWVKVFGDPAAHVLTLQDRQGRPIGRALVRPDQRLLLISALPAPPEGKVYQAWGLEGGTPVPLRTFRSRVVLLELPSGAKGLAVSLEPPGGSRTPTEVVGVSVNL
ncbi:MULTISPECIES: anti-sigma factor domain-containing protein [unclassified Meiothermus]|uniref:anti-sigma factor n=1 Tax=unclassified Meiothermus TaxID=370471 RepID=UPI000D7C04BD|nr:MULTISPECIES: anti-sigma factor [unclassified Meiothermus]PZA07293.1 anti-sigma factor [Meiothermus sp. Pnk-1]RYM38027.1 anti-sigma factor [Meiothermus sp. PNK-Is4]